MITIPKAENLAKYYIKEYNITSMLGKAELSYSDDFYLLEKDPNLYYAKLFKVEENKEIESI